MPSPERMSPESQRARLIPKLPEANIEPLDEERETTEKAMIRSAEAGSEKVVETSDIKVTQKTEIEKQQKAQEDGRTLTLKKLEAGMDAEDLRALLEDQLAEIEDNITDLEEADDQPVVLDSAYLKREQLLAGMKALEEHEAKEKRVA